MSIIKSPNDPRLYQMITLSNKMEILLISDQDADKSAACLNISIGSIDDPKDSFGLAHFHEHMLFLGTEKYPNQNDFSSYLSKNGCK